MPPSPVGLADHPDSSWPFSACSPLLPSDKGVASAAIGARLDSERKDEVKDDVVDERERPPEAILSEAKARDEAGGRERWAPPRLV
jgi:hypothetical protein